MTKRKRIVLGIAAASLALVFVLPLWRITLEAPQYPEGLGMHIRVNTITGIGRNDLQNINGLNHYVGMARIEPESFPELRYMPWIVLGLMAVGLTAAATGSRRVLLGWAAVFGVTAVVGLADFYKWEYDYGHNLDPTAAIKVPGLAYQPPLIGSKKLLNFTAHSWPASGGWIVIGVFGVSVVAAASELRRGRKGGGFDAGREEGDDPRDDRPRMTERPDRSTVSRSAVTTPDADGAEAGRMRAGPVSV